MLYEKLSERKKELGMTTEQLSGCQECQWERSIRS